MQMQIRRSGTWQACHAWSCQTTDCTGKSSAHDVWTNNLHINDCRVLRLANPGVAAGAVGGAPQRQLRSNKEVINNELSRLEIWTKTTHRGSE